MTDKEHQQLLDLQAELRNRGFEIAEIKTQARVERRNYETYEAVAKREIKTLRQENERLRQQIAQRDMMLSAAAKAVGQASDALKLRKLR